MIRKLMASSALAALMAAGAFGVSQAQTEDQQQPAMATEAPADQGAAGNQDAAADQGASTAEEGTTPIAEEGATLTPDQPTIATAFIGRAVYTSEGDDSDNIGEVNDLIIGTDGKITHAVVGVGGFLGIGEKDVPVPFDQLKVVQHESGDVRLIYAATREQLESAEPFYRTAFDPEERADEQQAGADGQAGTAGTTATDPNMTAGADATADADNAAGANMAAGTDQTDMAAGTDQNAAATDANAPADATAAAGPGFVNFTGDQVRASDIIGQSLYGAENESIGEVSDLVLDPQGSTRVAVVDVGGFLGIGEKRVAIPFDQIELKQDANQTGTMATDGAMAPAATDGAMAPADPNAPAATGGAMAPADPNAPAASGMAAAPADGAAPAAEPEPRLTVAMTREQLEQLPEWQDTTDQGGANQNAAAGQDGAAPADGTAAGGDMAAAPADPNAPAADGNMAAAPADANAPADGTMAADQAAGGSAPAAQYQTATQDLSADDLMGSAVYSQSDENLGEVGDVIFTKGGDIEAVVVDVGGFLGIGEKPVAVQFDALNVQKNADNGDIRLMVNATQEQLEAAPAYNETTGATGEAGTAQPAPAQ